MSTSTAWMAALAIVLAVGACAARESHPDPESAAARDARLHAAERADGEQRARRVCRQLHGERALVIEMADGHLVCRRGGPAA